MLRTGLRIVAVLAAVMAFGLMASAPASADGWHGRGGHSHSRFVFGFNFGAPSYWGPPGYYAPAYYYPPPVYYAPPPPVYYAPPQVAAPAPAPYCRDYRGDATLDGQGTPFYGRACLQADGRWHIVN